MRFLSLSGYVFSSHPGSSYPSDSQAALPTGLAEPWWLPKVLFGYTDEKLNQRASCICQQSHLWGKLLCWGSLDFSKSFGISRVLKLHHIHICHFFWILVLSCHAFHFLFLIISTAIHLAFHFPHSYSSEIMVK